jgi:hypothetical protein
LSGLFADFFEPDATYVVTLAGSVAAGTILADHSKAIRSFGVSWKRAELLLSQGPGAWHVSAIERVGDASPTLVLIEGEGHVLGGYAAVPWPTSGADSGNLKWSSDPECRTFIFTIEPEVARYALTDGARALSVNRDRFRFGDGCLAVWRDGTFCRCYRTSYEVPKDWTSKDMHFSRFEVWRLDQ